jgi:predicted dehydrogenase
MTQRVLILGYGKIAREAHGPAWQRAERDGLARVVRVVEPSASGCKAAKAHFPTAEVIQADARSAFEGGSTADVADICTPGHLHHELVVGALSSSCHVLVEKPLAHSAAEVDEIIAARDGAAVQVCHTLRLSWPVTSFRAAAAAGNVGEIKRVQVTHHARHILSEAEWVIRHRPDGAIFENAIHFLDLAHHILEAPNPLTVEAARFQQTPHRAVLTGFELLASDARGREVTIDFRQDSLAHSALSSSVYVCASGADAELRFYPDGFRLLSGVLDPVHDLVADVRRLTRLGRKLLRRSESQTVHDVLVRNLLDGIGGGTLICPPEQARPAVALASSLSAGWQRSLAGT